MVRFKDQKYIAEIQGLRTKRSYMAERQNIETCWHGQSPKVVITANKSKLYLGNLVH